MLSEKLNWNSSLTLLSANHEFGGNCPLIFEDARPLGPTHIVLILEVGVQHQSVHWLSETPRVPPENLKKLGHGNKILSQTVYKKSIVNLTTDTRLVLNVYCL